MNRKQKIIISISGIFIVMLALVGLTYAYFLTRITGNENDKSISVTTANLELVYGNDDGSIIGDGEIIEPSDNNIKFYVSNEETDDPTDVLVDGNNNPIVKENKTFTVTNNGEDSSYVVIIDVHKGTLNMNDTGCNFIIPAMQLELQAHRSIVTKEYPSIVGDSINLLPYIKYNDTLHFNPLSINTIIETFFNQFDF